MSDGIDYGELSEILQEMINNSAENCTPIPNDFFDKFAETAHARQIGVSVAFGLICATGLIANAIVMFLLLAGGRKGTTFKAPSTILIMNLAVADTLFLLTLPFAISHRLHKGWKFGAAMCKFEEGVKFLNYYGSVFFITAMAVDRYLVISRPALLNRKVARKYMLFASGVLWCLALIAIIPMLIFAGVDSHGFCSIMFPREPTVVHNSSAFLEALHQVECLEDYLFLGDEYYEGGDSDVIESNDVVNDEVGDIRNEDGDVARIAGSDTVQEYVDYIDDTLGVEFREAGYASCKHPNVPSLHTWLIWNFIIGFVVPFFIIAFCYARLMLFQLPNFTMSHERRPAAADSANNNIVRQNNGATVSLREDASKLITQVQQTNTTKTTNEKAKLLMNVLVPCLIAAFAVCWLPYHLIHLLQINGINMSSDNACNVARDVTFCLAFFNSALNPILNSFFLYNFKQRFRESKTWFSSQLKNLGNKKKTNRDDTGYTNGSRRDNGETILGEEATTMMTSAVCFDDENNA